MFGVWFTFTLSQPNGMSGMNMSGGSASMNMAMAMNMSDMSMTGMNMAGMKMSEDNATADHASAATTAEDGTPVQPTAPQECDQHDCCCSAVSPTMLAPVASLAWLPDHIINQDTPQSGDCVVHTDGQLLLPFANGPPQTVSA